MFYFITVLRHKTPMIAKQGNDKKKIPLKPLYAIYNFITSVH